jgi:hypothetical protein
LFDRLARSRAGGADCLRQLPFPTVGHPACHRHRPGRL